MAKYDKADLERRMKGAVEALKHDLSGLRTGRANVALLDPVHVEVYGQSMPLNQVATVSAPEANSRSTLDLPGLQEKLIEAIAATGKPFVVVLFNGRPLSFGALQE